MRRKQTIIDEIGLEVFPISTDIGWNSILIILLRHIVNFFYIIWEYNFS